MHQTVFTLSQIHVSLESSPPNLQKDWKLWSDRDKKNPKPRILWSQKLFFLFQHLRTTANVGFLTTLSFELLFLSYSILVSCFTILKSESFLCCLIFVVSFRSLHKAKRYLGIHDLACSMRRSTASPWHHFSSGWEGIGIFQKLIDENWQT